jgi:hypothetical protein
MLPYDEKKKTLSMNDKLIPYIVGGYALKNNREPGKGGYISKPPQCPTKDYRFFK